MSCSAKITVSQILFSSKTDSILFACNIHSCAAVCTKDLITSVEEDSLWQCVIETWFTQWSWKHKGICDSSVYFISYNSQGDIHRCPVEKCQNHIECSFWCKSITVGYATKCSQSLQIAFDLIFEIYKKGTGRWWTTAVNIYIYIYIYIIYIYMMLPDNGLWKYSRNAPCLASNTWITI